MLKGAALIVFMAAAAWLFVISTEDEPVPSTVATGPVTRSTATPPPAAPRKDAVKAENQLPPTPQPEVQTSRLDIAHEDQRPLSRPGVAAEIGMQLQTERALVAALDGRVADAERTGAARLEELRGQLETVQSRAAELDQDLDRTRQRLAQSDRIEALSDAERRERETAVRDDEATPSRAELRDRLTAERSKTESLERELAETQSQLARAVRAQALSDAEHRERELAARDLELATAPATGDGAIRHGPDVPDTRVSMNEEPTLTVVLPPEIAPPVIDVGQERAKHVVPGQTAADEPAALHGSASTVAPPMPARSDQAALAPMDSELPLTASAHVVLRYSHGSLAARAHAAAVRSTLQAQGLDVADPVDAAHNIAATGVTYFYAQDQGSADRVAGLLPASRPLQARVPASHDVPRPGTIEVSIAG